ELQRIGQHTMVELHRERVFEEIAPEWRIEEEACQLGHPCPIDQWPGIVDETGTNSGDQRAEIDLDQYQRKNSQGCDPNTPRDNDGHARCKTLRRPQNGGEDQASKRQMERQPIL